MSRMKSMPRLGLVVIGVVIGALLLPTGVAAAKAGLKFTGIEGTSGNQADVTSAGQLQVAPANPRSLFQNGYIPNVNSGGDTYSTVATPPVGDALVVENVHFAIESLNNGPVPMYLTVRTGTNCSTGTLVPGFNQALFAAALGDLEDPLAPGLVVPNGDTLCLLVFGTQFASDIAPTVSGYTIPAADAS